MRSGLSGRVSHNGKSCRDVAGIGHVTGELEIFRALPICNSNLSNFS